MPYCGYPPVGVRGVAHSIARASKRGLDPTYLEWCAEELLIMCQIESEEAVEKVQEIAAVDGLDCIMLGPTDLSANMGYIRDPGRESAVRRVQEVEKAVLGMKPNKDGSTVYLAGPMMSPRSSRSVGIIIMWCVVLFMLYSIEVLLPRMACTSKQLLEQIHSVI